MESKQCDSDIKKCSENGTETAKCNHAGCEEADTRTEENSALGHEFTNYLSNSITEYSLSHFKAVIGSELRDDIPFTYAVEDDTVAKIESGKILPLHRKAAPQTPPSGAYQTNHAWLPYRAK